MSIVRTKYMTPEIYTYSSRDFQLLTRLYDYVLNGVKFDIDSIQSLINTQECRANVLQLLQGKVGFFTEHKIDDKKLRLILDSFPIIVKNKGSMKAVKEALFLFLRIYSAVSEMEVSYLKTPFDEPYSPERPCILSSGEYPVPNSLVIKIRSFDKKPDTTFLEEIFRYILPIGLTYYIEFEKLYKLSDLELIAEQAAEVIYISDNLASQIRGSDQPYDSETSKTKSRVIGSVDTMPIITDTSYISNKFIGYFNSQSVATTYINTLPEEERTNCVAIIKYTNSNIVTSKAMIRLNEQGSGVWKKINFIGTVPDLPTSIDHDVANLALFDGKYYLSTHIEEEEFSSAPVISFDTSESTSFDKVEVDITPLQSGSGDPSPVNIRPITGYDTVDVTVCGKNIFDNSSANWKNSYYINSQGGETSNNDYAYSQTFFRVKPSTTYTIQGIKNNGINAAIMVPFYDKFKTFIDRAVPVEASSSTGLQVGTFITPSNCCYLRVNVPYSPFSPLVNIQIEEGETKTDYEAYSGNTTTVDLDDTVYRGTLNVLTGVLTVTSVAKTITSETSFTKWGGLNLFQTTLTPTYIKPASSSLDLFLCDRLTPQELTNLSTLQSGDIGFVNEGNEEQQYTYLVPDKNNITTVSELQEWLVNNPVTIVYPLYQPLTYQLTPEEVSTLVGENNVWSNAGNISVSFPVDYCSWEECNYARYILDTEKISDSQQEV